MPHIRRRTVGALVGVALLSASLGVALPAAGAGGASTAAPAAVDDGCPGGNVPVGRFTDDDGSVHEDAIACTTWWELTRGVSARAYAPARDVTRGQAATLVARLLTRTGTVLAASPPDAFPDDTGDAHSFAINRLADLGVVAGRADGRFASHGRTSRGAMASLLVAAYRERTGIDPPTGGDHFDDDDGTVHERAIDQAAELGLTVGVSPRRFDPWAPMSRGQAASLLARALRALDAAGDIGASPAQLRAATKLAPVDGCEALLGHIKERALESVGPYGLGNFDLPVATGGRDTDDSDGESGGDGGAAPPTEPTPSAPTDPSSSGTNNQETGVDEADIVKVAGTLVVAVNGGTLRVVDATDGDPTLLGTLPLEPDGDHRLLLDGDRLLVVSTTWSGGGAPPGVAEDTSEPVEPWAPRTILRLVDLTDPSTPTVTGTAGVDGSVLGARLVAGVARIVVRSEPTIAFAMPAGDTTDDLAAATARNRAIVETSTLADWVPDHLACDGVSTPPEFAGLGFSSVLTVDLDADLDAGIADPHSVGVLAGGDLLYASTTTLYLATTRWSTWLPMEQGADPTRTDLHAFDIRDPAGAAYLGSGRVAGHLLNQFSLSEHDGVLRVASTTEPMWSDPAAPPGESRVTTLRLAGDALTQVGVLTGLGVDEQIYGVRFLGDRGYVVTFRMIDPLYVLDLSDAANPRVTGELEMPGYSAYLHPLAGDLLLGVGVDADLDGRRTGVQVSLFDVSDPAAPRRLSHLSVPDSWTDVEHDHLAFLWWAPASLAMVPLYQYELDDTGEELTSEFVGAVGFSVDPTDGIAEAGRVSHADHLPGDPDYGAPWIRRNLVVDGHLVTLSDAGLEVASLDGLGEEGWLPFG